MSKRTFSETDDMEELSDIFSVSSMLTEEEEYELLMKNIAIEWDENTVDNVLNQSVNRYKRYLSGIDFSDFRYISEMIQFFFQLVNRMKGDVSTKYSAYILMRKIDKSILREFKEASEGEGEKLSKLMEHISISPKKKRYNI